MRGVRTDIVSWPSSCYQKQSAPAVARSNRSRRAHGRLWLRSVEFPMLGLVSMYIASRRFFCIVILVMAGCMVTTKAWGHRDRGPNDPCRRQLGASLLHLTLYQPQFDPDAEYCEEVPRAGKTIFVVDVTAGELRQTPIGLEVV